MRCLNGEGGRFMMRNNQFLKNCECFLTSITIMLLAFAITGCSSDVQNTSIKDTVDDIAETAEKAANNLTKDDTTENQEKFLDAADKFYDTYMEYFGENFSIDDEPFEYGEYKGDNQEKYYELAAILDDMCKYYGGIKKQSDRYDALDELPLKMYDYTYNVRQMMALIEGTSKYDEEKFTIEYSDYIVDAQ
jgi:hypothetical protein